MLDENTINERIKILDGDIAKVQTTMQSLEKQTKDAIAMMNALQGAKQQCESFLQEIDSPTAANVTVAVVPAESMKSTSVVVATPVAAMIFN